MCIIMNSIDEHTNVVGVVWGFIQLAFRGLANTFNCCFILFTNIAREGIAEPNMRDWGGGRGWRATNPVHPNPAAKHDLTSRKIFYTLI